MLCSSRLRLTTPWESARGCEPSRPSGSAGKKRSNRNPEDARGNVWRTWLRPATPRESARGCEPSRTPAEREKRSDRNSEDARAAYGALGCDLRPHGRAREGVNPLAPRLRERNGAIEILRTRARRMAHLAATCDPTGERERVHTLSHPRRRGKETRVIEILRTLARRMAHLAATCDPTGERERVHTLSHPRGLVP